MKIPQIFSRTWEASDETLLPEDQNGFFCGFFFGKRGLAMNVSPLISKQFFYPNESNFFSQCIEHFVFGELSAVGEVAEFGSGDGEPVLKAMQRTGYKGRVVGFEINQESFDLAIQNIGKYDLEGVYRILNKPFEADWFQEKAFLIANPPYLPAPNNKILLPSLHGGEDGADVSKSLFDCDFERVLLVISSYSNPEAIISCARDRNYVVTDFLLSPAKFSYYSSDEMVKKTIVNQSRSGKAFYSRRVYLLAGTLFLKRSIGKAIDLSGDLLDCMKALNHVGDFEVL